ncbi:50S ribosomal protein L3 [Mycobacterium talmoniae]|uniref:50S ribosomal protein L3 n=1 Tax=Mycobacterium talmoniae TaxID=1858794 RepID=A0A2S8BIL6_9MYCO|nr:50S ribosomal protein L3 [Mycobacterium talmoniae]
MARKGILGTKLGMTQVFDENNKVVPVTVVKAGPNVVTRIRTPERDGYSAVQLAYGEISPRKVNKPVTGQYAVAGVNPRRHLAELRLDDETAAAEYEVGQELTAEIFADGSYVDVTGTSKGKGFAGTMKRHGFRARPPATAPRRCTAGRVRSAAAPPPAGCSRAPGWPAGWVTTASPPRTWWCTRSMRKTASC